jgi:hypothetical protein
MREEALLPAAVLTVTLLILFVSRPGEHELKEQLTMSPHHHEALYETCLRVSMSRNPLQLMDRGFVTDFGVFTMATPPRPSDMMLIGMCGKWFSVPAASWNPNHDVLAVCALYALSLLLFNVNPRLAWELHTPRVSRPWTFVASGFACPSVLFALGYAIGMLNVGFEVRSRFMTSSAVFWLCVILPPSLAALSILAVDSRGTWPLGPAFGNIALAVFGAMADPLEKQAFLLFGQIKLGFFGCAFAECTAYLISQPLNNMPVSLIALITCLLVAGALFISHQKHFSFSLLWTTLLSKASALLDDVMTGNMLKKKVGMW